MAAMVVAALNPAGGCRSSLRGGQAKPSAPAVWESFRLRPGDYFKYAIVDHTQAKQGWVSVQVAEKGANELETRWEGELGGQQFSVTTVAPADRLIELSRPALITSPPAVPFVATILSFWWDHVSRFRWEVGATWTAVFPEMVPVGFLLKVEGHCSVAGVTGFWGQVTTGAIPLGEVCVSPQVPLPLSGLTKDTDGNPRYETGLIEYTPARR